MKPLEPLDLPAIESARQRLGSDVLRTPLVRLQADGGPAEIYLKLENLQPIGSFKLRGALNAMRSAPPEALRDGVYTASAGNMAQGVVWAARQLGIVCRVIVPERAPRAKTDAIERLGGEVLRVSFDEWWRIMLEHGRDGMTGLFIHPFADEAVMAGNATIGLEILEDLPEVDAVIAPFGGGGLSGGIASCLRLRQPATKVYASEVETAAPLAASLAAKRPLVIEHAPSFVDGIGGKSAFPVMWPLVCDLLAGSIPVSLRQIADAIRLLIERHHIVAEGAGASSVAAALTGRAGGGRIVCIVSGGNIDSARIAAILDGRVPAP
jgi:threonine dehydratase